MKPSKLLWSFECTSLPDRETVGGFSTAHLISSNNHGSSRSCLAVFRSSGAHCSIDFIKLTKASFLFPSRLPSSCSRLLRAGIGTLFRQFPKNHREHRSPSVCGEPTLTFVVKEFGTSLATPDECCWRRPKHGNHLGEMSTRRVAFPIRVFPCEESPPFKQMPALSHRRQPPC